MSLALYDAHNHLHDERLKPHRAAILAALEKEGVVRMVVNGSSERDWPQVLEVARLYPQVLPSFGCHPWHVQERTAHWQTALRRCLDEVPAAIGEIGLDRWLKDFDPAQQEEVFLWQWRLAAELNLPVSIHCLKAWGRLFDLLQNEPRPACGFVLHSFGGPPEMIGPLAELGAYFSLPGYFAHERKQRQRQAFRLVPADRLLLETDAPDQPLPATRVQYPLTDAASGRPLNHPANLAAVYRFAAELLAESLPDLAARVERNFLKLFGAVGAGKKSSR